MKSVYKRPNGTETITIFWRDINEKGILYFLNKHVNTKYRSSKGSLEDYLKNHKYILISSEPMFNIWF